MYKKMVLDKLNKDYRYYQQEYVDLNKPSRETFNRYLMLLAAGETHKAEGELDELKNCLNVMLENAKKCDELLAEIAQVESQKVFTKRDADEYNEDI